MRLIQFNVYFSHHFQIIMLSYITRSYTVEYCPLTKLNGGFLGYTLQMKTQFHADQLWFMTRIREEED